MRQPCQTSRKAVWTSPWSFDVIWVFITLHQTSWDFQDLPRLLVCRRTSWDLPSLSAAISVLQASPTVCRHSVNNVHSVHYLQDQSWIATGTVTQRSLNQTWIDTANSANHMCKILIHCALFDPFANMFPRRLRNLSLPRWSKPPKARKWCRRWSSASSKSWQRIRVRWDSGGI